MTDQSTNTPAATKSLRAFQILGIAVLVLCVSLITLRTVSQDKKISPNSNQGNSGPEVITQETKEAIIGTMAVHTTTPDSIQADNRQKIIDAMRQRATPSPSTATSGSIASPRAPEMSAEEKARLIQMMQQKKGS
jgi:hypothetical protein